MPNPLLRGTELESFKKDILISYREIDTNIIARKYKVPRYYVNSYAVKLGIKKSPRYMQELRKYAASQVKPGTNRKWTIDHNAFKENSEECFYWVGFLAADGHINKSGRNIEINLAVKDENHLKKLCIFLGANNKMRYGIANGYKYCRASFSSRQLVKDLKEKFGIAQDKTKNLAWPDNLTPEQDWWFLRGYFDGDGCVHIRKDSYQPAPVSSVVGTKKMIKKIIDIVERDLSFKPTLLSRENIFILQLAYSKSFCFLTKLYKDSTIHLDRKKKKFQEFIDHYNNNKWHRRNVYVKAEQIALAC